MTDVARKRALERRDLIPATFWIRAAVAAIFGLALLWRIGNGAQVVIRDGGALFGIAALRPAPIPEFLIYLTIDVLLITVVMWLYFRALQISPLSIVRAVSLAMHRRLFAQGWLAPARAVIREKGSRYMLLVSLIFSVTNKVDKKLVTVSDIFTEAFAYGVGLSISFWIMGCVRRSDFAARGNWKWISLAAALDAVSLLFQLASYAPA
jgi:hypothetical protein